MNKVKRIQSTVLIVLLLLLSGCGGQEQSTAKKMELPSAGLAKLVINHKNGSVKITGRSDSDKIEVDASVKASGISMDNLELKLEAQQDTASLDARFKGQFLSMGEGSVDLEIKVPKQLNLEITSHRDGKIQISDVSSNGTIDNINGDIEVSKLSGTLKIKNQDGGINVQDIGSDVKIDNNNGHIVVNRIGGSAEIHVGDGSLDIDHVEKDATITQTGSGEVKMGEIKGKIFQNL
ncbi:hypothetical protein [Paenibacillus sp. J22TS3]|uniref:hypothetical protein n=1 Tax=Paenibacillus sp. J22TS3 TaxID=2807192 RepID=UPI001AFEE563|nr:hypothetical protein [Paenibacillus sp. J22TS3]GIP22322.1 hypothetical protein J22TS3_25970 [Paenibacillus sp. J22TS3]